MLKTKHMKITWNYRILAHEEKTGVYFQVHTVFYENGRPVSYGESGSKIGSDTIEGLKKQSQLINESVLMIGSKQPKNKILYAGDKFTQEYN